MFEIWFLKVVISVSVKSDVLITTTSDLKLFCEFELLGVLVLFVKRESL